MEAFKVGQRVVCINRKRWFKTVKVFFFFNKDKDANGPKEGDILRIAGFNASGYLTFTEWSHIGSYCPSGFRPIDEDFAEEVIKNIKSKVKTKELISDK